MLQVYDQTRAFPQDERFELTAQPRFLRIALGSAKEVHNHLIASRDLGYLELEAWRDSQSKILRIKQMIFALIRRLETVHTS